MKYQKIIAVIVIFLFVNLNIKANNPDWGSTGHRTVGKIAEEYLTGKTKRAIEKLLNGQSLALVSTFGDDIKSDKKFREFSVWHYVNMPFGVKYEDAHKNEFGDLVVGIQKCKDVILDKNASEKDKIFHLKMLVHLIGDLHQPMHVGRKEDKGGNDLQVQWFNNGTNLHRVWDSDMINHYNMTYTELAENSNKLSKKQVKFLQDGSIDDWVNETQTYAIDIYASVKVGEKLGYRYMYDHFNLLRSQLQKGGIRLAKVLNELFA